MYNHLGCIRIHAAVDIDSCAAFAAQSKGLFAGGWAAGSVADGIAHEQPPGEHEIAATCNTVYAGITGKFKKNNKGY